MDKTEHLPGGSDPLPPATRLLDPSVDPAGVDPLLISRLIELVEHLPHVIGITDGAGGVLWVNPAGRDYVGAGPDDAIAIDDLFTEDTVERYFAEIRPELLAGNTWRGDLEVRRHGGTSVVEAFVTGRPGPEGTPRWLAMLAVDVTEQRRREADLAHRASHDPLTGLPNRALLEDRLSVARSVAQRMGAQVALIALDLDGFKQVNDTLGHAAGDVLLQQVTARLNATVRPADTVARYGGDEFMVVLHPPESAAAAVHVAQRMRQRLRAPAYAIGATEVRISASVGLTVVEPDDDADVSVLLAAADRAMYRAKRAGGDCVRLAGTGFDDSLDHLDDTGAEVAASLADGRFSAAFDPLVDTRTGEVVAVEVVPVWDHPIRGRLDAHDFLEDAAVTGHADVIRWAAIEDGLRRAAEVGVDVPVELSLSLSQLREDDTPARLSAIAAAAPGLDLCANVSERDLVELGGATIAVTDQLRAAGYGIVLSDHGAGGLPVALLADLELRMVEIDPAITITVRSQPTAVALAASLGAVEGVPTVATEVVTLAAQELLSVLGVDWVQGAVTGGPVAADQLAEIIRPRP